MWMVMHESLNPYPKMTTRLIELIKILSTHCKD